MPKKGRLRYGIAHDPCLPGDRAPLGAVPVGTPVRLLLRVDEGAQHMVASASVLVFEDGTWRTVQLAPCETGFTCTVNLLSQPHVAFYVFSVTCEDGSSLLYVPCVDGRTTAGELVCKNVDGTLSEKGWAYAKHRLISRPSSPFCLPEVVPGFQVTVYDPAFQTPDWLAGAVMYQVFPDRFARGSDGVRAQGLDYHAKMGRPVRLHEDWGEPVEWEGVDAESVYDPVDFYGGTLQGIRQKLPYLASLGVEVLYLNPVFEARSNHRYDTADYEHIDSLLGSDEDFAQLAAEAERYGVSILIDGVLSHTGNDSRYFNACGVYDQPGAAQGDHSPYRSWYDFTPQESGAPYRCWWGDPTLPEVEEHDASWQHYILGEGGILQRWLAAGARGYRLDVADEVPDDVLALIRACVKGAKPDAAIIGEVWEDATTKESYGVPRTYALGSSLDSVMNYPLRNVILGFSTGNLDAFQLAAFLRLQQGNYPPPMYRCLMNLLSSHDVDRLRTVLALGSSVKNLQRGDQVQVVAGITPERDELAVRLQRMAVGLQYALPGTPCLYYGDERGLQGGGDPFCRATFPWDDGFEDRRDCGIDLTAFYRQVGMMRKEALVLRNGALSCVAANPDVLCIVRSLVDSGRGEGDIVVAVVNRSDDEQRVTLDLFAPEINLPDDLRCIARSAQSFDSNEDGIVMFSVQPVTTTFFWC